MYLPPLGRLVSHTATYLSQISHNSLCLTDGLAISSLRDIYSLFGSDDHIGFVSKSFHHRTYYVWHFFYGLGLHNKPVIKRGTAKGCAGSVRTLGCKLP